MRKIRYIVRGDTWIREPADKLEGTMQFRGRFALEATSREDAFNIRMRLLDTNTDYLRRDATVCVEFRSNAVRLVIPADEVAQFSHDISKFYLAMLQDGFPDRNPQKTAIYAGSAEEEDDEFRKALPATAAVLKKFELG